jgi:hypothetical protein
MPVFPVLLEPYTVYRHLIPRKWQTFHRDWQFQDRETFDKLGTNIVPLVSLFGNDFIYVSDADAVVEMATNINRFPKDLKLYGIPPFSRVMLVSTILTGKRDS